MPWALHYTGSARSDFTDISLSGDFTITFRIKFDTMSGNQFILGSDNVTTTWVGWFNGNMITRVSGVNITIPTDPAADVWYDFTIERIGSTVTFSEPSLGSANGTQTANIPFNQIARFNARDDWTFQGLLERLAITGSSNIDWNPDSSDRSGSTDQPVITDTIGSNDATGVNFPSFDPSVWVNTGSVGNNSTIDLSITKPEFSTSATSVKPNFNSSVSVNITKPEFSANATTSFTINSLVDIDINKPLFSVGATNDVPEFNSDVGIQISKPVFSSTAETIKPEFNSIVDLNISKPVFSVSASSLFLIQSTVDFNINKPVFSANAESLKPDFNSNVDFNLYAPLFSVSAENVANESNAGASITIQKPVFIAIAESNKPEFNSVVDTDISTPIFSATVINGIITLQFNEETNFNQPHLSTNVNQISLSTNVEQTYLSTNIDRN